MKTPKIVVVGSTNMDMVAYVDRLPKAGQTVSANSFEMNPGGKGANQAVACAQLGADTILITSLGDDQLSNILLQNLQTYHVNVQYIKSEPHCPCGVALIAVNKRGENQICVAPGANRALSPRDIRLRKSAFDNADMVILQLEIPFETVKETVQLASSKNIPIILNPAPAGFIDKTIYKKITYVTPNEFEAAHYVGKQNPTQQTIEQSAKFFLKSGVPHVIVTLGKKGVAYYSKKESYRVKAPKVTAIDTVGAGDAFNGGLAYALTRGKSIKESIQFANYVGALSTTKSGAQQSMPSYQEILKFIRKS